MPLDNAQLRRLRGLAHGLSPVVIVADKGLTDNVRAEVDDALTAHELIKVKLRGDREQRRAWTERLIAETGAEPVQRIGQVVVLFRRNRERPRVSLNPCS